MTTRKPNPVVYKTPPEEVGKFLGSYLTTPVQTIWIPGVPVAKGRPRVLHTRSGGTYAYSPRKTAEAEDNLRQHFMVALGGWKAQPGMPLALKMTFCFGAEPGTLVEIAEVGGKPELWRTQRPDLDNLEKLVMDALAPWLKDDAQVVILEATKTTLEGKE